MGGRWRREGDETVATEVVGIGWEESKKGHSRYRPPHSRLCELRFWGVKVIAAHFSSSFISEASLYVFFFGGVGVL